MDRDKIEDKAVKASRVIENTDGLIVVLSHIDADGVTSGCIALEALYENDKDVALMCRDQITEEDLSNIVDMSPNLVWFTDIGSGKEYLNNIKDYLLDNNITTVITDHHNPKELRNPKLYHINPELFGGSGDIEVSGATATYLVSKNLVKESHKLIPYVIVGAVGDQQAREEGKLIGLNREIAKEGAKNGIVDIKKGLLLFGRSYKSISYILAYNMPIDIPDLSEDMSAVASFLGGIGIDLKDEKDEEWRNYGDLTDEEREKIREELSKLMIEKGVPPEEIQSVIGEYYSFPKNPANTMIKYADEWSTLINSCSRGGDEPYTAILATLGDDKAFERAEELREKYTEMIRSAVDYVRDTPGVLRTNEDIVYAFLPDSFPIAATGSVASILTGSPFVPNKKLMVLFGEDKEEGVYHISVRKIGGSFEEVNIGDVLEKTSEEINGEGGGGHKDAGAMEVSNDRDSEELIETIFKKVKEEKE